MTAAASRADPAHVVARLCRSTPAKALALLSGAPGMATWNLGLWNTRVVDAPVKASPEDPSHAPDESLLCGDSLFDGRTGYAGVRVRPAEGTIEYRVGDAPDRLGTARIHARVCAGETLGYEPGTCLVALLAWRPADMDDARWTRLCATHETEIELIRARLERD